MKSTTLRRVLCASAVLVGAGGLAASALAQNKGDDNGNGKRERADFVRGNANTKAPRVDLPKNEQEAITTLKVVKPGIIEMQLPEDRMVNLVRVVHADGSVSYQHLAEGQEPQTGGAQGEVK